jgi:hypothetical protein
LQRINTGEKIMTEDSSSAIGRAAIDAYLDSVEQVLLAAHAPRGDRVQVLQDLESQIAEMLTSAPQPLTDEVVQSTIAKLEPPGQFAATYGSGNDPRPSWGTQISSRSHVRWPLIAALSCACLVFGCLVMLMASNASLNGLYVLFIASMLLVGFVLTPVALWNAVKQLELHSEHHHGRELVMKSTLVYSVIVPVLLVGFIAFATRGLILVPVGLGALVYLESVLIRRVHRHLSETLPPQPTGGATAHGASSLPMPAM